MIIGTHNGSFHADETMACAIISYLYENSQVIRSRDPDELEKADLIIDVSGINDSRHFDHHSPAFNLSRDNGIRYATAGLMWEKFGLEFLKKIVSREFSEPVSQEVLKKALLRIDTEVMSMIDLDDNGQLTEYVQDIINPQTPDEYRIVNKLNEFYQNSPAIPYIVAMSNLPGLVQEEQDKAFMNTVKILKGILVNASINAINTETGIAKVVESYQGGELLIMHEKLPWTQAVFANMELFCNCLLAVYPDREMRWRVQSLPLSKGQRFVNRLSAPKEWRGLNDEALDKVTGLKNLNFIHRSGFTGGASTFEDDLDLAKLWLKLGERAQK
ncbi:MAG: MYG1 family protein [Succinivibrio sp.]|nr:MYG1 family protein [Succinivibrio sp.]